MFVKIYQRADTRNCVKFIRTHRSNINREYTAGRQYNTYKQTGGAEHVEWIDGIGKALDYIEKNLTHELTVEKIANHTHISPFYFQKGFSMLCEISVSDYIRQRRLALAGEDVVSTDKKIIDIALKYGYDSPDSFAKAFARFHGTTPKSARKMGGIVKSFAPLKISFTLKGGFSMDYKIVEKDSFTIIGAPKKFSYDSAKTEIPKFWDDYYKTGKCDSVCGRYGVCVDEGNDGREFEYLIADLYDGQKEIPEGFVTKNIPPFTWAIFPCIGAIPDALQELNRKIFSEWLPNCKEYEFAASCSIEMYTLPSDYANGMDDPNYYCEIWVPIKNKA